MVIFPNALNHVLVMEGERFLAKRTTPSIPLRRHLDSLCLFVLKPDKLLKPDGTAERLIFAKSYVRDPEAFLGVMLHMTRFYAKMGLIVRVLRENSNITVKYNGKSNFIPINKARIKDLVQFIKQRYEEDVEEKAVARCKERLGLKDSKRYDTLTVKALTAFAKSIGIAHQGSKMTKEK